LGPFIVDFYCHGARLAIEVDGDAHDMGTRAIEDMRRDRWIAARQILVIRFLASDVFSDLEAVVVGIVDAALSRTPPSALGCHLPRNSGGGQNERVC
jgi:very-short-patch-repair endonuclease